MKLVFDLAIATWFLVLFLYAISGTATIVVSPTLIFLAMGFFVFLWFAIRALMEAFVPHVINMESLIKKSAAEAGLKADTDAS